MSRVFVSRLFLDISCDRDSVMLGSAKDFWRLHPDITDTDKLLDVATDKIDLILSSSVRDLPEFESIIQCYVHDMFPYYLGDHVRRVIEFVRDNASGSRLCSTRSEEDCAGAGDPQACAGDLRDPQACAPCPLALARPPRPTSYDSYDYYDSVSGTSIREEKICRLLPADTQFVDSAGKLFMTDKAGSLRWAALKMGGSIRWKLCREKYEVVRQNRAGSRFRVNALVAETLWVGTNRVGMLGIWPGIPRFDDTRKIVRLEGEGSRLLDGCNRPLALPATPLDHEQLVLCVEGSGSPGQSVRVIVAREMQLFRVSCGM